MPIPISCSSCAKSLKVKDELAGKRVKCPGCQQIITVPQPEPAPADDDGLRILGEEEENAAPPEPPAPQPQAATAIPRPGRAGVRGRGRALKSARKPDSPVDIVRVTLGGLVGAFLGALLWFVVAKGLKMNIGWLAIGIGIASGFGVAALSGGRCASLLPFLGAGCALVGFFAGEYMIYAWAIPDFIERELIAQEGEMIQLEGSDDPIPVTLAVQAILSEYSFSEYLQESFDLFTVLYVFLAMSAGFGIPKRMVEDS